MNKFGYPMETGSVMRNIKPIYDQVDRKILRLLWLGELLNVQLWLVGRAIQEHSSKSNQAAKPGHWAGQ